MSTLPCLVTQSCTTLFDSMDCSPPGSSVHGDSPGKTTGMGFHVLLQGIFSTQESNQGLLHCRWILHQLSYQGSPQLTNLPQVIVIDTIHLPIQCPFSSVFFAVLFSYRDGNAPNLIFQPSLWLGIATTPSSD